MRTEKLDRLITALGNPAHQLHSGPKNIQTDTNKVASFANDDAVTVDSSLYNSKAEESEQAQRRAKIERISSQIESGAYRPTSEEISVAFIKELGI